ncbi:anti-sigma factor family protein [Streptomyces sp. NPDC058326]|uniref:anti-sigma factor family protein n=1 Tax=Streptomyces sp. NPDC058326 TaxID=3346447 RepID=UPI0036E92152
MTSTTGKADTTQHPDVSEISDLTEGLLSPSRAAAVRRHLDDCPLCADVRTSLEEIRGLLGTLPGPPRMPADITGRIDAALAAEALLNATTPESGTSVSRETSRTPSETVPSSTQAPVSDRPAGRPSAATGPGRTKRPRRSRIALLSTLGAAFGAVILGTSLFLSQTSNLDQGGTAADTKKAATAAEGSLSPFSGSPVEDRVQALMAEESIAKTPRGIAPESMSADAGTTTGPQLSRDTAVPGCVLAGTGRTDAVLGHERGEYQGTPAYLLVLPDPTDSTRIQAYVLDASCVDRTTGSGSPAADLLFSQSYPRP